MSNRHAAHFHEGNLPMKRAIYGAGNGGRSVLENMHLIGDDIAFFVDEFIEDREVLGKPVLRVSEVQRRDEIELFFTLSADHKSENAPGKTLIEELKENGFGRIITWDKFMWRYPGLREAWEFAWKNCDYEGFLARFYPGLKHYEDAAIDDKAINYVKSFLSDQTSIDVLDRIINLRSDLRRGPLVDLPDQIPHYFPATVDIYRGIRSLKFADVGGFDGDTMMHVMNNSRVPVSYIASFEPDPRCFTTLQQTASILFAEYPETNFVTYSCGVWSKNGLHYLSSDAEACAKLTGERGHGKAIPVVTLDAILADAPPNFIKYDVEGAENDALLGSQELIRRHHPTLAVSIYHWAHDLWTLPILIKDIYPDYEMYVRHHHWGPWETVLYCVAPGGSLVP